MGVRQPESLGEVHTMLTSIEERMKARDELDAERRKTDDERHKSSSRDVQEALQRIGIVESKWDSFFSEKGAFPNLQETIRSHGKKIDRSNWLLAVGVGILIAVEVALKVR